jgi:hypothetical protein
LYNGIRVNDSLVAEWTFDEGSGNIAYDTSPKRVNGVEGNAIQFSGKKDIVSGSIDKILNSEITMACWFKSPGGGGLWPRLVELYGNPADSTTSTALAYDPDGSIRTWVECETDGVRYRTMDYSGTLYTDNKWHYAVYTYNGSRGALYIDGELKDNITGSSCSNIDDAEYFAIGNYYAQDDYGFYGDMDEVRIFDRAISGDEINESFCIGAYKLNQSGQFSYPSWCNNYIKSYSYSRADYRFINSTNSELNYWLENDKRIWVNVTFLPNNTNTTIYIYYGNPNATSESNGTKTFNFFDDFEGTDLDSSKWNYNGFANFSGIVGYYSINNGLLKI